MLLHGTDDTVLYVEECINDKKREIEEWGKILLTVREKAEKEKQ